MQKLSRPLDVNVMTICMVCFLGKFLLQRSTCETDAQPGVNKAQQYGEEGVADKKASAQLGP